MLVAICQITLLAPHCHSLKEKRAVVRQIVDKLFARYKVKVAEVGGLDTWQRIELGIAIPGGDGQKLRGLIDKMVEFIDELGVARIADVQRDVLSFGKHRVTDTSSDDWEPDFTRGAKP